MKNQKITIDKVVATYKYLLETAGYTSCDRVADYLNATGFVNQRNRPVTRYNVHNYMNKTAEGKNLIGVTKARIGRP